MDTRQVFTRFSGLLIFAFAVFSMRGQTPVGGGWGGIGDPSEAPGNPASSYALGSVDYVNYYSGSVNVAIPLPRIGGRGDVLKKQTAQIQRQWSVYANAPSTNLSPYAGTLYTPGQIMIVTASANPSYCYNSLANAYYGNQATSYIVWTSPEGSQTTLTDVKYGGQPLDPNGSCQPADRGAVFRSTDGSGLVFLATSDVHDGDSSVAGTFISRDGTKYTFQNFILMTQIEDRNGNLIQFTYLPVAVGSGATHFRATDSVGRIMNVFSQGNQTVISYPGLGGASRTVTVSYAPMQSALASGEVLQNYNALFPQLSGSSSTQFNPSVVSSIILADGTSYTMLYNSYGELVKLTLPTGGVIGYKYSEAYSGGSSGAIAFSDGSGYKIQRPLAERDEYSDGSTLSAKLLYSASAGTDPASGRPSLLATVKFEDPNGNVLRQENHYFYGNPLSNAPPPAANTYADWWEGLEYRTDVTDGTNTMQSTQRVYQQRPWAAGENPWFSTTNDAEPLHDPQLCQVNTTVNSSTSGAVYMYDQYNNPTDQYQFDFGHAPALGSSCPTSASGFLQHTNTSYLTSNAAGNYTNAGTNLVSLPSEVKVWDGSGNLASNTKYDYDRYDLTGLANCPGIIGHDNANFAGGGTRGNVSFVSQYLNTLGSWINTATRAYDIAGSIVWEKDGNGNPTSFFYADNYTDGNDSRNTCAFLTGVQNAKLQFPYQANHDYNTGKPVLTADLTGNYSVNSYGTLGLASDRLTQVLHARGTPAQTTTNFIYNSPTDMVTKQDQSTSGDVLVSEQRWDGFGRPVSAIVYEAGGSYIETDTAYDALGRVVSVTNPWRGGDTPLYTKYGYDALGRQTSVTAQDGIVTTTASYAANTTTVTDEAGKTKKLIYDALGRLTNVIEDPGNWNTSTSYTYTATTTTVNQCYGSSCQVRAFTNDTLGRQIAATNPESGTVSYTYDYAGNLLTKTDARHRTATYNGYDGLNRPSSVTYSDGTPTVNFAYDGAPNGTGQLTSIAANGISTTNYTGFDAMGRVTSSNQQIGGKTYNFSYGYNLAGALTSETYPSGRVATTSYNQVNRPVTLSGSLSGQVTNYVTDSRYWAAAKYWTIYGNSVWNIWGAYNARLQPTAVWQNINNVPTTGLRMEMPNWVDGSGHNNGTLQGTTILAGGPDSLANLPQYHQTFGYDGLNRLTSASESGGWSQTYQYDAWGNMWMPSSNGLPVNGAMPTTNVYSANGPGYNRNPNVNYDAAGNQLAFGALNLTYDAENRQISAANTLGGGTAAYYYDGAGQRVMKVLPNGTTVYVYDAFGQLAAEYASGPAVGSPCGTTCYLSYDLLGSVRLVTDGQHNVIARHDYAPFGQEIPAGVGGRTNFWAASDNINQKFTGQERDGETNLDFFQARYMSSGLGRFMSPDPGNAGADFTNPQSWNGYAYVLGNPLGLVDPSGMDCEDAQGGGCLPLGFWLSPINPCKWAFFCGGGSPSAAIPDLNDLLAIWLQAPSRGGRGTSAAGGGGSATATSAPAATPPATSAPAAAPPKNGFQNNKQIQACLNDYYGSEGGKVADFFSALGLVPGWSPNATENFKEIGTLTLGKYAGLKGLQTAANRFDTQEIISIFGNTVKIPSSAAAGLDVGLHALGKSATVITAVATTTDIMAHYACAMTAYPTPSVPSPF